MTQTNSNPFSAFLRGSMPASSVVADEAISALLDALDAADEEARRRLAQALEARTRTRMRESRLSLASALDELTSAHSALLERAREAVLGGVDGAWEGLERLAFAVGTMSKIVAGVFLEASEASGQHYRELYLRTPVVMHEVDTDFRLLEVTDRWCETMEYAREEVIGRSARDFATEETRNLSIAKVAPDFFRTGKIAGVHYQYVTKSGKIIDFMLEAVLRRDAEGKPVAVNSVLIDVTEQMRIERALRESEERYRLVVERSPLAIAVQCEGVVVSANGTAATILGAAGPEELVGRRAMDLVHPDERAELLEGLRHFHRDISVGPLRDTRFLRLDGSVVEVALMGTAVHHEGKPAVQSIFIDISERIRAREVMQRSALQEEIIRAQEESLLALSTPLIPVSERVLVMPLIGRINEGRAQRIIEVLLSGVTARGATHVILDVTGVPEADTEMADALIRASRAVRLLGANVILSGIQPAFARTLIELGVDVGGLVTQATLAGGIRAAMGRR